MRIERATKRDIESVAAAMRESDFREFSALLPVTTREELTATMVERYGARKDIIVAHDGDRPVAIGGTIELRPNVITLAFFATDALPDIGNPLTRFIKQRLFPRLVAAGVHRIECVSIVGHHAAHRWIETLGLRHEAICHGYGKGGEDFIQFAWVRHDIC